MPLDVAVGLAEATIGKGKGAEVRLVGWLDFVWALVGTISITYGYFHLLAITGNHWRLLTELLSMTFHFRDTCN